MPWGKRTEGNKVCVYKKTTGKTMHCYSGSDADEKANRYLAALHMHASEKELEPGVSVFKEADGRYKIVAVSTAALKDREGETFEAISIDYDAKRAEITGDYPEFRLFHKKHLAIGKVEKMRRAGIFAVDEGHSYTDPFSLEICKELLAKNDGKWRISRGFYVIEASGKCPNCSESLLIQTKHMVTGFKCPKCKSVHANSKGVLKEMHFRKTKTFDVTITDNPAVPWTGVTAFKDISEDSEVLMTKKELRKKLLDGGVDEAIVDAKLDTLTDAQLKEYTDVPFAEVLKEFSKVESDDEEYDTFALDPESLKEFGGIVESVVEKVVTEKLGDIIKTKVAEAIEGLEIDIPDMPEVELKELPQLVEVLEKLKELQEAVDALTEKDESRLKTLVEDMPRSGKLRIRRYKASKKYPDGEEDDEDASDEEDMMDEEEMPMKKKKSVGDVVILGSDGKPAGSMTEFVLGK